MDRDIRSWDCVGCLESRQATVAAAHYLALPVSHLRKTFSDGCTDSASEVSNFFEYGIALDLPCRSLEPLDAPCSAGNSVAITRGFCEDDAGTHGVTPHPGVTPDPTPGVSSTEISVSAVLLNRLPSAVNLILSDASHDPAGLRAKILFSDDAILGDDKGHDAAGAILGRVSEKRKPSRVLEHAVVIAMVSVLFPEVS
jgi:hypothetical protein